MIFTSRDFLAFLAIVFTLYWSLPRKGFQNVLLLVASYVFYGWIHPWFCVLIATSTLVDYVCGRAMQHSTARRSWLTLSLVVNLGMLGVFKYFTFFADSAIAAMASLGLEVEPLSFRILLPAGISFYTFQTLSYTIDIYRGQMEPRRNFVDFALFVSFFPQLVAGPIERARRFLPQIESPRSWQWERVSHAFTLIVRGYLKKLVVADNIAIVVNKVFMLEEPTLVFLFVGALAFAMQVYGDFSAYTDIARGCAKLLGFELTKNFDSPYLSISPSDHWRRWHITLSTWIRDYLYIPIGGSRVKTPLALCGVFVATMGLSGLWHGAAWNFVLWGIYHGLLIFGYHVLGFGGRWRPATRLGHVGACATMFSFTCFGYLMFRASDMGWLLRALYNCEPGFGGDQWVASLYALSLVLLYSAPLFVLGIWKWCSLRSAPWNIALNGMSLAAIVAFGQDAAVDFVYFQF